MIVVVGSPVAVVGGPRTRAAGVAAAVARAAVTSGAAAELVGRLGDDPLGDEVLLDVAAAGTGHVAVLRTAGDATPTVAGTTDVETIGAALTATHETAGEARVEAGLALDAGDLDLALRYLPDYRVVVVATDLDPAAWATVIAATAWAGAHLIGIVPAGAPPADVPDDATILERPAPDADDSFGHMVGRYAAALDAGEEPSVAFRSAASAAGWASVSD